VTSYVALWLRAFAATVAVELCVAVPLLKVEEASPARRAEGVVLANLASHPMVWFAFPLLGMAYPSMVTLSEAWAVGIELLFYRLVFRLSLRRALAVSALANGASFAVGLALRTATGWV
jgi:hypothetical protein